MNSEETIKFTQKIPPSNRLVVVKQYIYEIILMIDLLVIVKVSPFGNRYTQYIGCGLSIIGVFLSVFIFLRYVKWAKFCLKEKLYPYPYRVSIRESLMIKGNAAILKATFIYWGASIVWLFVSIMMFKYVFIERLFRLF